MFLPEDTSEPVAEAELKKELGLGRTAMEARRAKLSHNEGWWREGTRIFWSGEAADALRAAEGMGFKPNSPDRPSDKQLVRSTHADRLPEGIERIKIVGKCANPIFLLGDDNGQKVPIRIARRNSVQDLVGKVVHVRRNQNELTLVQ